MHVWNESSPSHFFRSAMQLKAQAAQWADGTARCSKFHWEVYHVVQPSEMRCKFPSLKRWIMVLNTLVWDAKIRGVDPARLHGAWRDFSVSTAEHVPMWFTNLFWTIKVIKTRLSICSAIARASASVIFKEDYCLAWQFAKNRIHRSYWNLTRNVKANVFWISPVQGHMYV